jgi:hypothetical protein
LNASDGTFDGAVSLDVDASYFVSGYNRHGWHDKQSSPIDGADHERQY